MARFYFFLFILFVQHDNLCVQQYDLTIPATEFRLVKMLKTKHSFIGIVRRKNRLYIVKQKRNRKNIPWSIIQSVIADHIANSTEKISSQHIFVIPKEIPFPGKIFQGEAASLHTIVPGMSVQRWQMNMGKLDKEELRELMRKFSIKQHPKLNISIIRCMAKHKDLPFILALHTLVGFYDGHKRNVFYDTASNRFSIIDMDCSYKINLASRAHKFIKKLLGGQTNLCKPKIQSVLLEFANALELIMSKNSIDDITQVIATIESSITRTEKTIIHRQCQRRVMQIEEFLKESYAASSDIIALIRKTFS